MTKHSSYVKLRPRLHRSIDAPIEDSSTAIPQELRMEIGEPVIIYCLSEETTALLSKKEE